MLFLIFVLGACFGSFLNVVIHRLPRDESLVLGRSKCPSCGSTIRMYDNIPVLSYLLLRGRCRDCAERISLRYPLVELASGFATALNFHMYGPGVAFLWSSSFLLLLLAMAVIDGMHMILPDELTFNGFVLGLGLSLAGGPVPLREAIMGSVMGGGFLFLVSIVGGLIAKKEVMGEGDIKMMAMVGAYLGWKGALLTIFLGSLLGTLVFGPISLRRKVLVPFGVFLAVGGCASLYFENRLIELYFHFFQ
jgi:leader peptidase (prepilin peptidase)/N-methyltransferase